MSQTADLTNVILRQIQSDLLGIKSEISDLKSEVREMNERQERSESMMTFVIGVASKADKTSYDGMLDIKNIKKRLDIIEARG
jgi:predicted  nucleic acid-binding Zn-ribbon protein